MMNFGIQLILLKTNKLRFYIVMKYQINCEEIDEKTTK